MRPIDQRVCEVEDDRRAGRANPVPPLPVHRLRNLGPRDRLIAIALGLALLVAPVSSAVRMFGSWTPSGDDALIELRARDVATPQTPLIGQPSSSSLYGQKTRNAAHPGPIEFYLLAPAERLLGGGVGMLSTVAAITGFCVLVAAWAVYRQLGRGAGLAAAAALAAVMWTSGAAVMVDPLSSSVGRFPLLCSVVLLWCLLCGDVRLLALTCVVVSFTLQQHLSVVPATAVVTTVGVIGLAVALVRQRVLTDIPRRREVLRSFGLAATVGLVVWAPVLYQQFTGSPGNLTRIVRYGGDKTRVDVGYMAAIRQLAHTVGLPPLLGRTNVSGLDLLAPVSVLTWVTAFMAAALLVTGALVWRRRNPRQTGLVIMAGAVGLGGLLNGSSVPVSLEQIRIAFYHWVFALAFLELLILLVAVGAPIWRWVAAGDASRLILLRSLAGPAVLVVALGPAIGNLVVARADNHILRVMPKSAVDGIDDEARNHLGAIKQPTLLSSTAAISFSGFYEATAMRLIRAGVDVVFPASTAGYVADDRLVDYRTVRSGLVLAFGVGGPKRGVPGTLIASADPAPSFDRRALARLIRQADSGSKVVLGRALERQLKRRVAVLRAQPRLGKLERQLLVNEQRGIRMTLLKISETPAKVLAIHSILKLLAETPMIAPKLDHRDLESAMRTYPSVQGAALQATHLSLYLLNHQQLLQYVPRP